jgi:putative transposase
MHKGEPIRALLRQFPRLELHRLPPYAPELNPVEHLWNHLKYTCLVNFAAADVHSLDKAPRRRLHYVKRITSRLRSFFNAAKLPLADEKKLFSG